MTAVTDNLIAAINNLSIVIGQVDAAIKAQAASTPDTALQPVVDHLVALTAQLQAIITPPAA